MAKTKALREKKTPKRDAPIVVKTIELWCDVCHTRRSEGCFLAWQKCPFKDCRGTLRTTPPPALPPRPRFKRDKAMPLLKACEG
jgi:hypothetical protein